MKEFTVKEILEYSRNIEQESYKFYKDAGPQFKDDELKKLADELATEEMGHYNRLNRLLENTKLTEEELNLKVQIKNSDYEMLIGTRSIPENPTALSILETAYQREVNTGNVYRTLISFTNLTDDLIETFSDLVNQEKGHANRIESIMKNYK
ncbi:MAG: ferritin family protein [Spirochaetaceae bacterium]|nr:ferritin family protein [Spirochaetaceae bacterium]